MNIQTQTPEKRRGPNLPAESVEGKSAEADKSPTSGAEDVLEEALRITSGDRRDAYGPVDGDFTRTAQMWSAILDANVTAKQVALCMIALKLSRATWSEKRDNWVDIAGYARCGSLLPSA